VKRLVVNADDFGLSDGVNRGVLRAHVEGIVTSTSLMVRQPAAAQAAQAARKHPSLSLGLHVDLAEWEFREGDWRLRYAWVDPDDPDAVAAEVGRQLLAFRDLVGRDPTHLDSHQHVHRDAPARSVLAAHAAALGVPLRHHPPVRYCGAFYGQGRRGSPLPGAIGPLALAALIRELPDGMNELCCHPAEHADRTFAYGAERAVELASLCHPDVRRAVREAGVRLCSFEQLALAGR
jgi:predicted glycoside hydrolase/deacetylase ChbG (UPF0249 family)